MSTISALHRAVPGLLPAYLLCGMAGSENSHLFSLQRVCVVLSSLTFVKSALVLSLVMMEKGWDKSVPCQRLAHSIRQLIAHLRNWGLPWPP